MGVNGYIGVWNFLFMVNLVWFLVFMWDGGINYIEVMFIVFIINLLEMNEFIVYVLEKLNVFLFYWIVFVWVYNVMEINF